MRHLLAVAALVAAFVFLAPVLAHAQERIPKGLGHPGAGQPHWYDRSCCDMRDCEPVEEGAVTPLDNGGYFVRYHTSNGFIVERLFKRGSSGIKQSKDGKDHACAIGSTVVCVYPKWQGG
jgi:hypothetical protein